MESKVVRLRVVNSLVHSYDLELNQVVDQLDSRMVPVRRLRMMSPAQVERLERSGRIDLADALGKIFDEAGEAYSWARKREF